MKPDLHLVGDATTRPVPARTAGTPAVNLTARAIDALAALSKAAEFCLAKGLTVAGAIYGNGAAQPALRVVWHPLLAEMVRQGRAWDDGTGTTGHGLPYRKGHFLVADVLVIWGNFEEAA